MTRDEVQQLRDLPIEGVAERLGLRVVRHKSLCPFHASDKHPSMSYHTGRNIARCFVCMDEAIGPIDLVMRRLGLGFRDACRWLADEHNVILTEYKPKDPEPVQAGTFDPMRYERFFVRPWLSPEACHFLFDERRLDPRVISWCRVTSWRDRHGVNWLQTPYYDVEGRLIGVQNRNLDYRKDAPQEVGTPRFRFPYGSRCSIYNLPMLRYLKPGDECWIAEGCSDTWAHMSDHHKVIAIPAATLLKPQDKVLLREVTSRLSIRWRMAPDHDAPGERLFQQLKEVLPRLELVPLAAGCKDFGEMWAGQVIYKN